MSMFPSRYTEGKFRTFDETRLFFRFFPGPSSKKTVLMLHGMGEHSGRYHEVASHINNAGYSAALLDYRGHGRSEGVEVYVNEFSDLLKDVSFYQDYLIREFDISPEIVLFGHSLGGLIATHWAMTNPLKTKKLILSAPCFNVAIHSSLKKLNDFVHNLSPTFIYWNPVSAPNLTHDPEMRAVYLKDAFIRRKITSRLLREMILAGQALEIIAEWIPNFRVTVFLAGNDKIVDNRAVLNFYDKIKSQDKELYRFEGFYHEIFNETERQNALVKLGECLQSSR